MDKKKFLVKIEFQLSKQSIYQVQTLKTWGDLHVIAPTPTCQDIAARFNFFNVNLKFRADFKSKG